jgi:hypothetical protein
MDRKWISTAFYRHQIEQELRNEGKYIRTIFSSYNSFDEILPFLEKVRAQKSYPHLEKADCQKYLCKFFQIIDGFWGNNFPHCAAPMQVSKHALISCCVT